MGRTSLVAGVIISLAVLAAYHNTFGVPLVFDDTKAIADNPTIRHLWPPREALHPPHGKGYTVEGRPILNLSFALNYAISGTSVWSYHALNLAIHVAAALLLYGIIRRTLRLSEPAGTHAPPVGSRAPPAGSRAPPAGSPAADAEWVALMTALIWALHPLQTESVTYISQRAESLMGLLYLATLYGFIRAAESGKAASKVGSLAWRAASWIACLLGMGTKEVMVSAPVMVWLYDRTFVAGSFGAAWRRRRGYYLALAATWVLLLVLVVKAGNRGGTIGAAAGVTPWQYALCQTRAVIHYLRLTLWPYPLVFDYGADFVRPGQALPYVLADLALVAGTVAALRRRPVVGFLGAWFFVILAPSSSFVGGTRQMLAEHRIYLSLAAVAALAAGGLHRWAGRRGLLVLVPVAAALGAAASFRNADYRSLLAIYRDTVAHRPENAWAQYNLGDALLDAGFVPEAIAHFTEAAREEPALFQARYNLGNALATAGRLPEAVAQYREAIRLARPYPYPRAHYNLGNALMRLGRREEAAGEYVAALREQPGLAEAEDNLGSVLFELGRLPEAMDHFRRGLRLNPNVPTAHYGLGNVLLRMGRPADAAIEFEEALRLSPDFSPARERLALARLQAAGIR